MRLPQTTEERLERVRDNLARFPNLPRFREPLPDRPELAVIVGYGPSLHDTWPEIAEAQRSGAVVFTTSGAHDFLIERGVIPAFHVEMDPREHKAFFLRNPHPDVTYCLASHCHPSMFESVAGHRVVIWHGYTDDDHFRQDDLLARIEPGSVLLCGGSNAGLRCVVVARHYGHCHFALHGIDCSYREETLWAGKHSGERHCTVKVRCNGKIFSTSDIMMSATDEFLDQMLWMPDTSFYVAGDGLLAERLEVLRADPARALLSTKWWEPVDFVLRVA